MAGWNFWVDRGGTFTDLVARDPQGTLRTKKLLSENPDEYDDAVLQGISEFLEESNDDAFEGGPISAVKMGTTVATNALLERKGDPTLLVTTQGFGDALRIGYQNRPKLFDLQIKLPEPLYQRVVEVKERVTAKGEVLEKPCMLHVESSLKEAFDSGMRACAIVFVHGYKYPEHERNVAKIAKKVGFTQISVSHEVSPLIKFIGRGDTTVVDAYLSPILKNYVHRIAKSIDRDKLFFMKSNGGLTKADLFLGKDSVLSGPAGGIVGAAKTSQRAGLKQVITFDMGGTSTDVALYNGSYERSFETIIAGARMRVPMMHIHTVAAGGGSILRFDQGRFQVGPQSAGARPGPACYRLGGPLTVTDCNVILGRIQPDFFPHVFGKSGQEPLDVDRVKDEFVSLASLIESVSQRSLSPQEVADGFLRVAVENMAQAIKKISIQKGHDVRDYALCTFGGAGGQHACLVADALGMKRILVHPLAGVLSAYGMGLAELRTIIDRSIERPLNPECLDILCHAEKEMRSEGKEQMLAQGVPEGQIHFDLRVHMRVQGADAPLAVPMGLEDEMRGAFRRLHRTIFGFDCYEAELVVEAIEMEVIGASNHECGPIVGQSRQGPMTPIDRCTMWSGGQSFSETPIYERDALQAGDHITGPAMISEANGTTVVDKGWIAQVNEGGDLLLDRSSTLAHKPRLGLDADPVMLEIFNNLFMSVAEQMGVVLAKTSHSVNIKERLDFSCAVFDNQGKLVANAPHMPVHLGSMGESVRAVIDGVEAIRPGDIYMLNAPYNGGTHLPDITVITPIFGDEEEVLFYVASRGHHADIGGITPGSMPPLSRNISEEGVLFDCFKVASHGVFLEDQLRAALVAGPYPARNPDQNVADLKAQIAANEKGASEMKAMIEHYGLEVVLAYMRHVQSHAEEAVRRVVHVLKDGSYCYELDDGSQIQVSITIDRDKREATIDFTGTSGTRKHNFNGPKAVTKAAVLYVFRTLVTEDIPMNEGCLKPLNLILPDDCMLNPSYPAAVVAGNVETSQCVVDALYGALGVMAASQGTMNNLTFGDDQVQYYETICGGSGAGPGFHGASGVQTHMTNSRLTDPEVLEHRYPVMVEDFSIRKHSGGQGAFHGGDGVSRSLCFHRKMTAAILSNRRKIGPFGINGGYPGALGRNRIMRKDGSIETLHSVDQVELQAGDRIVIETPGGGGYGHG